jgi:hypothetical protein
MAAPSGIHAHQYSNTHASRHASMHKPLLMLLCNCMLHCLQDCAVGQLQASCLTQLSWVCCAVRCLGPRWRPTHCPAKAATQAAAGPLLLAPFHLQVLPAKASNLLQGAPLPLKRNSSKPTQLHWTQFLQEVPAYLVTAKQQYSAVTTQQWRLL